LTQLSQQTENIESMDSISVIILT